MRSGSRRRRWTRDDEPPPDDDYFEGELDIDPASYAYMDELAHDSVSEVVGT